MLSTSEDLCKGHQTKFPNNVYWNQQTTQRKSFQKQIMICDLWYDKFPLPGMFLRWISFYIQLFCFNKNDLISKLTNIQNMSFAHLLYEACP